MRFTMHFVIGFISIFIILLLAWLFSFDKKNIRYRYIVIMLVVQFILAFILLNTTIGNSIIGGISQGFVTLLSYASEGVNFVFGNLINHGQMNFFFNRDKDFLLT